MIFNYLLGHSGSGRDVPLPEDVFYDRDYGLDTVSVKKISGLGSITKSLNQPKGVLVEVPDGAYGVWEMNVVEPVDRTGYARGLVEFRKVGKAGWYHQDQRFYGYPDIPTISYWGVRLEIRLSEPDTMRVTLIYRASPSADYLDYSTIGIYKDAGKPFEILITRLSGVKL
jgi:hypothetical protein